MSVMVFLLTISGVIALGALAFAFIRSKRQPSLQKDVDSFVKSLKARPLRNTLNI